VLSADIERCPGDFEIDGTKYTRILVQFVWRGKETQTSWPAAHRLDVPPVSPWLPDALWQDCANRATYLLAEVYAPTTRAVEDTWKDKLGKNLSKGAVAFRDGLEKAQTGILWAQGLGIAAGVVLVVLWARNS